MSGRSTVSRRSTQSEQFILLESLRPSVSSHLVGPPWLLAGLAIGAVFAVLVVVAFVAGQRLFPTPDTGGPQRDGDARRHEEIRHYLEAIGEEVRENETVEGHSVAFYLPEREVAITFDARAYLNIRDAGTAAVLCEHEMPGTQLGHRLPFEAPTFDADPDRSGDDPAGGGWTRDRWAGDPQAAAGHDGADPEAVRAAFASLGLSPGASGEAVQSAYRERVTEVHPDQGGDPEAFRSLQEAYAVASEHADAEPTARAG